MKKEIYILPNEELYPDIYPYHEESDTLFHFEMIDHFIKKYHLNVSESDNSFLEREGFITLHIDYAFDPVQICAYFPSTLSKDQYHWLKNNVNNLERTDFHADILIDTDYYCTDADLEGTELEQCLNYIKENCLPKHKR